MVWLFFPVLAFAFSSGPKRTCTEDVGCVLVKETQCGEIFSVALGQDQAWADFQAKAEKNACTQKERPDHRDYAAVCQAGECVAVKRPRPAPLYIPPAPKQAPKPKR
jgi:hypothetical protein